MRQTGHIDKLISIGDKQAEATSSITPIHDACCGLVQGHMMQTSNTGKLPIEYWPAILIFYRQLVEEVGSDQQPMLDFVERLAASKYAQKLYPSTSHDALGLATVETYEERRKNRAAFIEYQSSERSFKIYYMRRYGSGHAKIERTNMPDEPTVFQRIVEWLYAV